MRVFCALTILSLCIVKSHQTYCTSIEGSFRLNRGYDWVPELADPNSAEYQELSDYLRPWVLAAFGDLAPATLVSLSDLEFADGPSSQVEVAYNVVFNRNVDLGDITAAVRDSLADSDFEDGEDGTEDWHVPPGQVVHECTPITTGCTTIRGEFRINQGASWTDDLLDPLSLAYQDLYDDLAAQLHIAFTTAGPDFVSFIAFEFIQGPNDKIDVHYIVVFQESVDPDELNTAVTDALRSPDFRNDGWRIPPGRINHGKYFIYPRFWTKPS